jgi:hypothetical protein
MLKSKLEDLPPAVQLLLIIPMAKEYTAFLSRILTDHILKPSRQPLEPGAELKYSFQTSYYGNIHNTCHDSSLLKLFKGNA